MDPAVPGLAERLAADPPARVLDVACGSGWSSVQLARAYPKIRVDALDADAGSINRAHDHAVEAGLADRVTFRVADAADSGPEGSYDAALIVEALHDVPHPVEVLAAIRRQLAEDGVVLVGDVQAAEAAGDGGSYRTGALPSACARASLATRRASRSGSGVRAAEVDAASTVSAAVSGLVRQAAWATTARAPVFVHTQ